MPPRIPTAEELDRLVADARGGARGALARLLTLVETGGDAAAAVASRLHGAAGSAWVVGITGAPGAGKSTLTDRLVAELRSHDARVGVLAIDPSSPFSGGAILGDRVRMQEHSTDAGVFIRSMATRGHLGGLSAAAPQAVRVFDAIGFPWIVVETVGVGQVEVEIAGHADTTVVVVNPGWGDAVQVAKAGLMEIADVFVVNKADRPGARDTVREIDAMLELSPREWRPPIVETVATEAKGLDALHAAIAAHRTYACGSDAAAQRRRERAAAELRAVLQELISRRVETLGTVGAFADAVDSIAAHTDDPYRAARRLLGE